MQTDAAAEVDAGTSHVCSDHGQLVDDLQTSEAAPYTERVNFYWRAMQLISINEINVVDVVMNTETNRVKK